MTIHSCSYHCNKPECIKAQRDELREKVAAQEREACSEDAARYRWLRDNPNFQIEYTGELTLDAYIDGAMRARSEEQP